MKIIQHPKELGRNEFGFTRSGQLFVKDPFGNAHAIGTTLGERHPTIGAQGGRTTVPSANTPSTAAIKDTDQLSEGSANLYFTTTRAKAAVQPGGHVYGADAGGTDAYSITVTPAITALTAGQSFAFKANTANTDGATLQVCSLPSPAAAILKHHDQALVTGDIEAGQVVIVSWDGTAWQMQSQLADNTAVEVAVDASGFTGNLGAGDTTVQAALATIDGLTIPTGSGNSYFWLGYRTAWPSATSSATDWTLYPETANKQNVYGIVFGAASTGYAEFTHPLPADYSGGTLTARLYWVTAGAGTNGVTWGIQAYCYGDNTALNQTWGTAQTVNDASNGASTMNVTAATSAITIGGTPSARNIAHWRVYRNPGDAGDTLAVDAYLVGVLIEY